MVALSSVGRGSGGHGSGGECGGFLASWLGGDGSDQATRRIINNERMMATMTMMRVENNGDDDDDDDDEDDGDVNDAKSARTRYGDASMTRPVRRS